MIHVMSYFNIQKQLPSRSRRLLFCLKFSLFQYFMYAASIQENLTLLHAYNKGGDQHVGLRNLISSFVIQALESIIA